ncbi:RHS repeat-associated core domain-containing protein [Xanthomonas euvesicatoria]|uniref:RHS repeat-associated core domain-containing protein n=1 Tax=Xanthomonas euvesicatoria TaxID=456327 RepID=UPI0031B9F966
MRENNYWYDAKNRLTNVQNNAGATTVGLSYDPQGNLKNKNGQAYTFDYGNRLRDVTGKESYAYDAYGRRTIAGRPTTRTVQVYTQAGQLFYTEASGKGNTEYVYLNGSLLATRNSGTIKFQHTDALGSPIAVTDTAGQVVERTDYQPYGSPIGKTVDGIGYTGHAMDGATGLTYMQQRYYDQDLGRFLSIDPVAADSVLAANFNRYWYANNNPYRFTDPDGRNSVITTAKDGSISIDIPINFVGPGATQANIDSVKGDISARWSRAYNVKGSSVQVSVQVVPVTKDTPRKVQNTITLTTGPTSDKASQGASFVKDGKTGEWNITSRGMPYGEAAHEAGHLMRADDHYLATVDASGNRVSTPEAGYDKNLMGELGNPPDDRNMGEILSSRKNIYIEEK